MIYEKMIHKITYVLYILLNNLTYCIDMYQKCNPFIYILGAQKWIESNYNNGN